MSRTIGRAGTPSSIVGLVKTIRSLLRRRAGTALALGFSAVVGGVLILAWLLAGSDGWARGTWVPLGLVLGGFASVFVLVMRLLPRVHRWSREANLADQIEQEAALPEGSVLAQVELSGDVPPGVSASLVRAGEGVLLGRLGQGTDRLAGSPGRELAGLLRWCAISAGAVAIVVACVLILTPSRAATAWAGLAHPVWLLTPEPLPPLQILPGDAELPRGQSPRVQVVAEGRDSVWVHWQAIGDVLRDRRLLIFEGRAETDLPELEVDVRYWASSPDGAETAVSTLVPSDPSLLSDLTLEVTYPSYTRLPSENFRGVPAWLRVPEGTIVRMSGRLEGQGSEVQLLLEEGVAARMPIEEGRFAGVWRPTRSGVFTWAVEGGQEGALLPGTMEIEVVPDAAPELALPVPGADGELPLSLQLPLLVEAEDDYGISLIEIETVRQRPGEGDVPVVDPIPGGGLTQLVLRPVLDFASWGLRPGDAVLLKARATDNAPEAHVVETPTYRFSMPRADDVREIARTRVGEAAARAQELLDQVSRETEALRNLQRQSEMGADRSSGNRDQPEAFQDREELRQAIERQAELASELDQLTTELEETSDALSTMAERDEEDAALRERIAQLEQLLDEVLGPDARERLGNLQEELRQGEMQEAPDQLLEELAERQEDLQARLEQALEQLRRSALEEAFRGAEEDIRALVENQESLVDELAQGQGEEAQREQAARTEDVEDRLSAMEAELASSGDTEEAAQTEAVREQLGEARESMNSASESSRSGNPEQAAQQAQEAQESLESALDQLEETREEFAESPEEQMREGLRQGAQQALALARQQADLRQRMENAPPTARSGLEQEQAAILEGLRNLEDQLSEATSNTPEASQMLDEAMEASQEAVSETVDRLRGEEGARANAAGAAQAAQAGMNRIASQALSALGQGSGDSEGSPSSEQMGDQLASIGGQQQSLNDEATRLSEQSSPDGVPMPMELENLVTGQEGVAGALRELGQRPGPGRTRSNLDALADESDEIAEELRRGRLDATTLQRQDQFLERLLSAGRTLERDGPTDEREATSAEQVPRRAVTALPEALLDPSALPLPDAVELGELSPRQRRLVLDYFERVNRRRAGGVQP